MNGLGLGLALDKGLGISKSWRVALHTASGLLETVSDARLPTTNGSLCAPWGFVSYGTPGGVVFWKTGQGQNRDVSKSLPPLRTRLCPSVT